jgi:septal ring factor EnvC (AmiA/AmiB activator)
MTPKPSAATMVVHGPTLALRPMNKMRGLMPLPARGKVIARYGQKDAAGSAQKGIVLQTRARAQVIAPADGVVAFAGSFRGYGQLLIMEHGGGYHTLLSGLDRIDATVGQRLLMGEPVGTMGPADAPSLYFELRHDGQSINPMPWLTARKG